MEAEMRSGDVVLVAIKKADKGMETFVLRSEKKEEIIYSF